MNSMRSDSNIRMMSSLKESKYRLLFESSHDAILFESMDGKILDCNAAACALYGYDRNELLALHISDLVTADIARNLDEVRDAIATYGGVSVEAQGVRKDGTVFFTEVNAQLISELDNTDGITVVNIRDITNRKRAEWTLMEEKERLAVTLRSIGEGMISTDHRGIILFINRTAEKLTGWSQMDAQGCPFDDVFRLLDFKTGSPCVNPVMQVLTTERRAESNHDRLLLAKDGVKRSISTSAEPIISPEGELIGVVSIFRDTTRLEKNIRDLEQRDRILATVSQAAELLLLTENMSHALRTTLRLLGEATGVSRVYLFENEIIADEELISTQRFEWTRKGIETLAGKSGFMGFSFKEQGFKRWIKYLRHGKVLFGNIEDFPSTEKQFLDNLNIRSIAVVPVFVQNELWGFLGIDECRFLRSWSSVEIEALRSAASIIGSALNRSMIGEKLKQLNIELEERVLERTRALESVNSALQLSETRYRRLVENQPDSYYFFSHDAEGEYTYISPNMTRMLGYSQEEYLGTRSAHLFTSNSINENARLAIELGKKGILQPPFEVEIYHKDGSIRILEIHESPILDENDQVVSIEGIAHDITDQKRMQLALTESENKFRTLFEAGGDAVMLLDKENFIDCNHATLKIFGCNNHEDFLNNHPSDFSPGNQPCGACSRDLASMRIRSALDTGHASFEWQHCRLDGAEFPAEVLLTVVDLEDRRVIQAVVRDLTEKKQAEMDLQNTQTRLMESEKLAALGALVAGIAHEVNNPLGISVTAASHLEMKVQEFYGKYTEDQLTKSDFEIFLNLAQESSRMILTNLRRASEHIISLIPVAVDQASTEHRLFNLREYLGEILMSLQPELKKTDHEIEIDCPEDLEIDSFPGAFAQIITNLIMNSIIHGFSGIQKGLILITLTTDGSAVHINYSDNGVGIPVADLRRVFQPFFTTRRSKGGSGIGLHIVYTLVTRDLNGRISCESTKDQGTTFKILLPCNPQEKSQK